MSSNYCGCFWHGTITFLAQDIDCSNLFNIPPFADEKSKFVKFIVNNYATFCIDDDIIILKILQSHKTGISNALGQEFPR
jgi:hypothetical protein